MSDPRVFELVEVTDAELVRLAGGPITSRERVDGGLTNTIHKVVLASGESLAIKIYAAGHAPFVTETTAIARLAGALPVPEIVRTDPDHAIVYRWIEGITLNECRATKSAAVFASLAEPLGRLMAWMARVEAPAPWDLVPALRKVHLQLGDGRARERLGAPLADAMKRTFDKYRDKLFWGMPCLAHGDFSGRNILVQPAVGDRWRIIGVLDWESATSDSPLADVGSLFRYSNNYEPALFKAFERGYREADGQLPSDWLATARVLDALLVVDTLDDDRELPGVFADCRMQIAKLVGELG